MQSLLDAVRATGARNVVIAGGLDWAYDLSGILAGRQLSDPHGNGVIYANHCYDNKGDSVDAWIGKMEKAAAKVPVIVSEFGGNSGPSRRVPADNWLLHVLQAIDDHQWSFTAWDLHRRRRADAGIGLELHAVAAFRSLCQTGIGRDTAQVHATVATPVEF